MVTNGPYRRVRHPMYSGFFMIGAGLSALSGNWRVALLYLGTLLPMYLLRVSAEEHMMIGRFGDAYRQYMAVTGRLCPRLARR
jgi:protein-S-isoprenylcysteine O-methyltransferase Ste14